MKKFNEGDIISSEYLSTTLIPKGTKLDCYCNPYGVDSGVSKGYSTYYIVDKEMTLLDIMDLIERRHCYKFSNDEIELTIYSDEEDEAYTKLSSSYKE